MKNEHWMIWLQKLFYPFLAIIGIPSNLLTLFIFWRRDCGLSPSCRFYMIAISVADTMVILQIVILELILKYHTPEPFWSRVPWCMIRDVLNYGAYNSSVWLVVCFTIERFISIRTLCLKPTCCSRKWTVCVIVSVFICNYLLSVPYFWSNESTPLNETEVFRCVYNDELPSLYVGSLVWFQTTLVYIIPYIIIFTLNGIVLRLICQSNKVHCEIKQTHISFSPKKQRVRSMVLLVTVSMTFVCLCTMRFITQIIIKTMHYRIDREDYSKSINIAADIGTMLDLTNTVINIYLYACTQSRFRKEILQVAKMFINPCKTDKPQNNIHVTSHLFQRMQS